MTFIISEICCETQREDKHPILLALGYNNQGL
jgi:hypothetical protein